MGWISLIFLCIAGIAWGQMPVNPDKFRARRWGNILVSFAGPLANLLLATMAILLLKLILGAHLDTVVSSEFLYLLARINLVLCLLNLLPVPPLDGFHVLSEFIPGFKPLKDTPIGAGMLMILFLVPGFGKALVELAAGVIHWAVVL